MAITWDERNRRRRFPGPPRGWWHPVRPRPRIPVPGPVLALAAAAGLVGLIACAVLIVSRVEAYNTSGPYLRAGHPVRVLLAPDDYVVFVGCTESIACPRLAPGALSVTDASGAALEVFPDPSNDRLSEAQPFGASCPSSCRGGKRRNSPCPRTPASPSSSSRRRVRRRVRSAAGSPWRACPWWS